MPIWGNLVPLSRDHNKPSVSIHHAGLHLQREEHREQFRENIKRPFLFGQFGEVFVEATETVF
jgi:hypothetical protein